MHICALDFSTLWKACNAFPRKVNTGHSMKGEFPGHCHGLFPSSSARRWSFFSSCLLKKAFCSWTENIWAGTSCPDCLVPGRGAEMGITITSPPWYPGKLASFPTGFCHLLWKGEPCCLMTCPHLWLSLANHLWSCSWDVLGGRTCNYFSEDLRPVYHSKWTVETRTYTSDPVKLVFPFF